MKTCSRCNQKKLRTEFHKAIKHKDGLRYECKVCSERDNKSYRQTKEGVATRIYSSQRQHSKRRGHLIPVYTLDELREWLFGQERFHILFDNWVKSGFNRGLKPSPDRLDDYEPYTLDNLRLVTWYENHKKGYLDRVNGINNKYNIAVVQFDLQNNFIKEFHSIRHAGRETKIYRENISKVCLGKRDTAGGFKWKYKN